MALARLPDGLDGKESACSAGDPLEKEMATHSSILVWEIPWTEEPGRLWFMGLQESDTTLRLNHHHPLNNARDQRSKYT